jgi:hypothetical protein
MRLPEIKGAYRYAETNLLELQLPLINTENPLVKRMRMHMKNATEEL